MHDCTFDGNDADSFVARAAPVKSEEASLAGEPSTIYAALIGTTFVIGWRRLSPALTAFA